MTVLLCIDVNTNEIKGFIPEVTDEQKQDVLENYDNYVFVDGMDYLQYPSDGKNYKAYFENGEIVFREYTLESEQVEQTQLDRIEEAVNKTQAQIANEAVDAYTEELLERGIL